MGSTQSQTEKYTKNLQSLLDLQNIILDLNEDNIDQSVETSFAYLITSDYSYSFILILCKIVYLCFVIQGNDKVCFEYLIKIDIKNVEKGNNIRIIEVFTQFILSISSQESFYLLHKMIENGLIQPKICQYKNIPYFAHYLSSKELCYCRDCPRYKFFFEEIDKLSNNDWELQKQLINDGVNPSEIAQIIRNDEIEKLQEISSQTNFDFNQFIKPSLYERHSFLSQDPNELFPNNVSLVDYAAFFGSIKCFRYLLLNEANLKNSCRFAIAGGNNEILHLCEQNHIPFIRAYEAAIEYHRNDIFHYIYENKLEDNQNLILLGRHCIKFNNYDILLFLFNEGMEINEALIIESIANGNLFLTQYFLKKNPIIIDFLKIKSISGNNELLEFLINNKYIDLNQKIVF